MKKYLTLLFFVCFTIVSAQAQQEQDSTILPFEEYLEMVKNYHPVAIQAQLTSQIADENVRISKGSLDPKLNSDFKQKDYEGTDYYSVWQSELKIPTWLGVDFKVGYENNSGQYLNPEYNVPTDGLLAVGVELPLLKNTIYNSRRVAIKQAQLMSESGFVERRQILNALLLEATEAYWQWSFSAAQVDIAKVGELAAKERFLAVKESFKVGETPAVDTLEAKIQWQQRQFLLNDANVQLQNARLYLSNFLWFENYIPLELQEETKPEPLGNVALPAITADSIEAVLNNQISSHPEVMMLGIEQNNYDIQKKLMKNNLLPDLTLEYSLLNGQLNTWENTTGDFAWSNYKVGVNFSMPLFLRKERGYLNQIDFKSQQIDAKRNATTLKVKNKVKSSYNDFNNTAKQLVLYRNTTSNYQQLLAAERKKFSIGESSLFLVNSREIKAIDAQIKTAELTAKYLMGYQKVWYESGLLAQ